jgi:hypothetical protein
MGCVISVSKSRRAQIAGRQQQSPRFIRRIIQPRRA